MEDGCCSGLLRIRHGRVDALLPAEQIPDGPVIDARDARVIPGIIDTHNHGTCGWSLEHPRGFAQDVETVCRYVKACASQGITGVFPTAVPAMISACAQAAALNKNEGRDGKQNHLEAGSSSLADCLFLWALMELLMQPSAKTATIASIT